MNRCILSRPLSCRFWFFRAIAYDTILVDNHLQTGSYHFPLTIRPPTKMEEKIAAKNKRVIQIGLNTHSHDHEINPVTFSTAKIKTKATIGSILDRWDFFSVCITEPPWIPSCRVQYTTPNPHCKRVYVRRPQAAKVSPGEIPARQTPHRSAVSASR